MKLPAFISGVALTLLVSLSAAEGAVNVSSGYYDLSPAASGGGPALPDPWSGSANTTLYGSTGDLGAVASSDPDISALLLQNTGTTAILLSALSLTPAGMDIMARDGGTNGNLPAGSLTLLPGQNYIFTAGDGSEESLSGQTIHLTLNGVAYSFADVTTSLAPSGVLLGDNPQLGGGDETQPWALDGVAAPEPASLSILGGAVLALGLRRRSGRR